MLTIVQRGGATREKPPEVVRGFSARLPWAWDGLCFAVPFNDSTRDAARDLVFNAAPTVANGTWTKDSRGNVAARCNATEQYFEYPNNPAHNKPLTAMTAYARFRRMATGDDSSGLFCKVHTAAASPWASWNLQMADIASTGFVGAWVYTDTGGGLYIETTSYSLPLTEYTSIVMRWRAGSPINILVYDERGTLQESKSTANLSGTIVYNTQPIRINAFDITSRNSDGAYSQCMLWSRRLTDTEILALIADPYGWYSPRRETIGLSSPYPLVGGGGEMRSGSGGLR